MRVTERQIEALRLVRELTEPRGPTIRELAERLGVTSPCTVHRSLSSLVRKGLLRRLPGTRGVMLTEQGMQLLEDSPAGDVAGRAA